MHGNSGTEVVWGEEVVPPTPPVVVVVVIVAVFGVSCVLCVVCCSSPRAVLHGEPAKPK